MEFYHYTCIEHLDKILEDGYLKVCESNSQAPTGELESIQNQGPVMEDAYAMKGPDVVWLVKKRLTGEIPGMLISGRVDADGEILPVDKSRIEFSIELPTEEVQRSDKFFKKYATPEWWIKRLERFGGKSKRKDWYVVERPILKHEWLEIKDRYSGKVFYAQ